MVLRARLAVDLYRRACAAGRAALVLPSGGVAPGFSFNPTERPHWECVAAALEDAGLPAGAAALLLLLPGLPALHTVEEALLCRTLASHYSSRAGCGELQLSWVQKCTINIFIAQYWPSDYHIRTSSFGAGADTAPRLGSDFGLVESGWTPPL